MNAASVSTILQEGSVIGTKIGSNNTWSRNIVYKCEGSTVILALTDNYLESLIMNGSKIVLKKTSEYFEYIFEGIVTSIQLDFPSQISVLVSKAEEIINTRVFPRYDTYIASDIKPVWDDKKYFSIITNISLGGVAFASRHLFDYGEECDVAIYMPGEKNIICRGKIIRKTDKGEYIDYSMQFIEMDEINSNLVSEYLEAQSNNVEKLKSHFFDCIKSYIK